MNSSPLRTWACLLVLSFLAVVPFLPAFRANGSSYHFEYEVLSPQSGYTQVYWDIGAGYAEAASHRLFFKGGGKPEAMSHRLPSGDYRSLRFDPNDRQSPVTILHPRLTDPEGRVVKTFTAADFRAGNQIGQILPSEQGFELRFTEQANDPQVELSFTPILPLRLPAKFIVLQWIKYGMVCLALVALIRLAWAKLPRLAGIRGRVVAHWQAHPVRGLAWLALAATLLSTFPVWMLGRSFVSPNNGGAVLLYEVLPTVAGYRDSQTYDVHGSDVGAIMWQHIPYSRLHRDAILEGTLPLWNRYNSCGTSMLGQGQSMFGDPLLLLTASTNGASWAWDLRFLAARWLFCFGLGLCTWLVTRHLVSAHLIAFAAAFFGFFTYRLNHPAIFSMSYGPWVLWAWLCLVEAKDRRALRWALVALFVSNFSLLNSGTVKEAYMILLCMNLAGVSYLLVNLESWPARARRLLAAALPLLVFVLVTAPVWSVFLAQLKGSYTSYNKAHTFQLQTGVLLGFFDELFYRPLSQLDRVFNPSANFIILAGFAFWVASLKDALGNRRVLALFLAALFPASLAFGLVPPEWIVHTPFLGNVAHVDNSFSCALIILVAVLAGHGFSLAAKTLGQPGGGRTLVVGLLFIGAIAWMWINFGQAIHRSVFGHKMTFSPLETGQELTISPFIWGSLFVLVAGCAAAGYWTRAALQQGRWTTIQAWGVAFVVFFSIWRLGVQGEWTGFASVTTQLGPRVDFEAKSAAVNALRAEQAQQPTRTFGLKGNLLPGWNAYLRLEGINGPDALINPYYRELVGVSPLQRIWDWRIYAEPNDVPRVQPFLDFLNVRYLVDFQSDQALMKRTLRPVALGDLDVYESPTVWPRAFFTDRVWSYERPEQLVERVLGSVGRPFGAVAKQDLQRDLDYRAVSPLLAETPAAPAKPARDYSLRSNSTSFTVDAPSAGLAVLTEVFADRDFRATVNGQEAAVLRVNHAFLGVVVPTAGTHRIEIVYHPRGYTVGLVLFAAGLALGTGLFAYRRHLPI